MNNNHHYVGLTDAQVLESRKKYGANVLTPPEDDQKRDLVNNPFIFPNEKLTDDQKRAVGGFIFYNWK